MSVASCLLHVVTCSLQVLTLTIMVLLLAVLLNASGVDPGGEGGDRLPLIKKSGARVPFRLLNVLAFL